MHSLSGPCGDILLGHFKKTLIKLNCTYCVYIDDWQFCWALDYADDIVLFAPTATAMCKLLSICGEYATEYSISFNASKSKYLAVVPANRRELNSHLRECCFTVNGKPIELVRSFQHLGHTITSQLCLVFSGS